MKLSTKKSKTRITPQPGISLVQWLLLLGISAFFLIAPYRQGLYNSFNYEFERPLYVSAICIAALMLAGCVHLVRVWKWDNSQAVLSVGILFMPLLYWIAEFQAAASHNAELMTSIAAMYACIFLIGLYTANTATARQLLEGALLLSGYAIVIFGLLNMFGQIYVRDAVWFTSGEYRMASVFQYSNTYAGYLIALFLCAAYYATHVKRRAWAALHAAMLVPILLSFMLTYSRGAFVVVPFVIFAVLPFLRFSRQITYTGLIATAGLVGLSILGFVTDRFVAIAQAVLPASPELEANPISLLEPDPWQGWLAVIAASVATAAAAYVLHRSTPYIEQRTASFAERRIAPFAGPLAIIVAGAAVGILLFATGLAKLLLPTGVYERIRNINFEQHSVLERLTFYKDAMAIVRDYPLFGSGGGGWTALYEQYQNNPYISRQTHSFLIQTLVEIGWVGGLALFAIIGAVLFIYIKHYWQDPSPERTHFVFFIFVVGMLAHSMIDFDLSFVYLGALVFLCLGVLGAVYRDRMTIPRWSGLKLGYARWVLGGIVALIAVLMLIFSTREYQARVAHDRAIDSAIRMEATYEQLMEHLDRAVSLSPDHPKYVLQKVEWLRQAYHQRQDAQYADDALRLIDRLKQAETHNSHVLLAEYRLLQETGQYEAVLQPLEEGVAKFPWDIQFYELAIMAHADQAERMQADDPVKSAASRTRGVALYEEIHRRMELLKLLPEQQLQGRPFAPTPHIEQAMARIAALSGDAPTD